MREMGFSHDSASISWLSEYKSLKVRQSALEKECRYFKLRGFENVVETSPRSKRRKRTALARYNDLTLASTNATCFEEEKSSLEDQLNCLRKHSEAALLVLRKVDNTGHNPSTITSAKEECNKLVYLYEEKLVQTNEHFRANLLLLEQERFTLDNAVNILNARFKSWEESSSFSTSKRKPEIACNRGQGTRRTGISSRNNNEIVSFINDDIKRDGGKTGYWSADEHNVFLKVWARVKDSNEGGVIIACREQAASAFRHRSDEEIALHCTWYNTYRERCDKKRQLALEWRRRKAFLLVEAADALTKSDALALNHENEVKDPVAERQTQIQKERKHAKIRAWKELKSIEGEEAKATLEEKNTGELLTRRKNAQRHKQMKDLISDYKLKKSLEEEKKGMIDRKPTFPKRFTHEEMERRRQEELQLAKEKSIKLERKSRRKNSRQEVLKRLAPTAEVCAKRDRHRLLQSTRSRKTHEYTALELEETSRKLALKGAHRKPVALGARDLNVICGIRRATPTWRQGIQ